MLLLEAAQPFLIPAYAMIGNESQRDGETKEGPLLLIHRHFGRNSLAPFLRYIKDDIWRHILLALLPFADGIAFLLEIAGEIIEAPDLYGFRFRLRHLRRHQTRRKKTSPQYFQYRHPHHVLRFRCPVSHITKYAMKAASGGTLKRLSLPRLSRGFSNHLLEKASFRLFTDFEFTSFRPAFSSERHGSVFFPLLSPVWSVSACHHSKAGEIV